MADYQPSRTALGVATMRAVHQLIDEFPKILDDRIVLQLLDASYLARIQADLARFRTQEALWLRANVLVRSRYAEDRLEKAVERGIRQYVSLGAGFDTFPYRQPPWARVLRLFEVDQPASQAAKRERLQRSGVPIPPNVEFVSIDFERTSLAEGLSASGFDPTCPTFVSWLGVTMYLSQQAIDAVLRYVVSLPRASEVVFTFAPPATDAPRPEQKSLAERAAEHGEPWTTYIAPQDLTRSLRTLGFTEITLPTPAEIDQWYTRGRQDGLCIRDHQTIASAIV